MEGQLLGVLYDKDTWAEPCWEADRMPGSQKQLNAKQKKVDKWRGEKAPQSVHPVLRPFLKHALYVKPETQTEGGAFSRSQSTLAEEGASEQSHGETRKLLELD